MEELFSPPPHIHINRKTSSVIFYGGGSVMDGFVGGGEGEATLYSTYFHLHR
jgi:hypothetical protein